MIKKKLKKFVFILSRPTRTYSVALYRIIYLKLTFTVISVCLSNAEDHFLFVSIAQNKTKNLKNASQVRNRILLTTTLLCAHRHCFGSSLNLTLSSFKFLKIFILITWAIIIPWQQSYILLWDITYFSLKFTWINICNVIFLPAVLQIIFFDWLIIARIIVAFIIQILR